MEECFFSCLQTQKRKKKQLLTLFGDAKGAANIGDAGKNNSVRADKDVIPEAAIRPSTEGDYHTGRGGAGNAKISEATQAKKAAGESGATSPVGLADRLKRKILGVFKK